MLALPAAGRVLWRALAVLISALAILRVGVGVAAWRAAEVLEQPKYDVLRNLGYRMEIRKYQPFLIAETAVPTAGSSSVRASSQGFRTVAKYVFGGNTGGVKMKMTAPVTTQVSDRRPARVSFVMQPSQYEQIGQAPRPLNSAVKVKRVDGRLVATRSFTGPPPNDARIKRERELLLKALAEAGLAAAVVAGGETLVSGYHDPFLTPGPLRRNEVAVPLDPRAL